MCLTHIFGCYRAQFRIPRNGLALPMKNSLGFPIAGQVTPPSMVCLKCQLLERLKAYISLVQYSHKPRGRKHSLGPEDSTEQGQSKRQQFASTSEETTETENTNVALADLTRNQPTHAELNQSQILHNELNGGGPFSNCENLPEDLSVMQAYMGDYDPILDLDLQLFGAEFTHELQNPENTENPVCIDNAQNVPVNPRQDGNNYCTPRGRNGEVISNFLVAAS